MTPYSKTCYLCGKKVYPGTGTYHYRKLVHIKCKYLQKARNKKWK